MAYDDYMNHAPMDQIHKWLAILRGILPQYFMDLLETLYFNVVFLGQSLLDISPDLINVQTILPPLITLFTIYFALISLYHTTTFFVRTTIFFVKWGALIGALSITLGYVANMVMPESFTLFNPNTKPGKSSHTRNIRPRPWDSFDRHRQWHETQQETSSFASDAAQFAQDIMAKIHSTWLGTFTSLAAEQFMRDDTPMGQAKGKGGRALKEGKGKAKSR